MYGLTNASKGAQDAVSQAELAAGMSQTLASAESYTDANRGYKVTVYNAEATITPIWNQESRIVAFAETTEILITDPTVVNQSAEIRITFAAGTTDPDITIGMNTGATYTLQWADDIPSFKANCLYEISLSPISNYIIGYYKEIELAE